MKEKNNDKIFINTKTSGLKGVETFAKASFDKAKRPLSKHDHNACMEIVYIEKGIQVYEADGIGYRLKGGDLFTAYPYEIHSSGGYPEEKSTIYYFIFDPDKVISMAYIDKSEKEKLLHDIKNNIKRKFKAGSNLKKLFKKMFVFDTMASEHKNILLRMCFIQIIIECIYCSKNNPSRFLSEDVKMCIGYINSHIEDTINLTELSVYVNLSLSRFKQKFKEQTGIPPMEYITRLKIRSACNMIKNNISITQTAANLSFSSSQYFSTVFKKYMRVTPIEYRKSSDTFSQNIFSKDSFV